MTNRKLSRKRIGQALGLVTLGLVLLVGSAEYGSAGYGRIGGQQQIWAVAQQEESPATFLVEATVNRNGGLQIQLPDPPESPGVFLEVQWVVDVSREPHQLVPRGTIVSIFGIAKEGVTKWSGALAELGTLLFSATVGSGQETRQLFAEVDSSAWSGGFGLDGMATLNIFLEKIALGLLQQQDPAFNCCENSIRILKYGVEWAGGGTDVDPKSGNRWIKLSYNLRIRWNCTTLEKKKCIGSFKVGVGAATTLPKRQVDLPKGGKKDKDCKPAPSDKGYTDWIQVSYYGEFKGRDHVKGKLVLTLGVPAGKGTSYTLAVDVDTSTPAPFGAPVLNPPPSKK